LMGKSTGRNSRINSTCFSAKSIVNRYESEKRLSSHHQSFITIHVRIQTSYIPAGEYVSDWVADVKKGLNSLYVYCPLVEPRMVGDAQVPLLGIVPVEGRDG
jgi:hypothetical protein